MKRCFLAAALLLSSASLASADYVIIIANVGAVANKELRTQPGMGMAGIAGMPPGLGGGGPPAGAAGGAMMPGGAAGGQMPPGMGNRGMMPPGMGNQGMMPPGMGNQGMMPPGMGNRGMMPPGMMGGMGMAGAGGGMGMAGMRGGMMGMAGGMMGMAGGMMGMAGGMMGMAAQPDVDDVPYFIVAIVEVELAGNSRVDLYKKLTKSNTNPIPSAKVKHKWGTATLLEDAGFAQTIVITKDSDNKPLPTVLNRFNDKFTKTFKDSKPSADLVLDLAEWTLAHGLIEKFPVVMDKLVEIDKSHRAAVNYLKVKAELDKATVPNDAAASLRNKLLRSYKLTDGPHYSILHNSATNRALEVQSHLDLLENSFRGYYYWFALKGVALPVPAHRQLVVVTSQPKDFQHLDKILTSGPVVVDGFFARRENVAVMANKRQDETYDALSKFWKQWEDKGYHRTDIFSGKKGAGIPRGALATAPERVYQGQMVALMLKALEQEAELATISHDASRQLVFASKLIPRNVAAPEWILFGMGSFFETPLQSPWAGIGAPSAYYLPRWQELKAKGFEKNAGDTLRKVITDAYFRAVPPEGEADSPTRRAHDAAVRKARTASWALTYFLAKQKLDGLQHYFKELSKMPRDIELDEEVLLGCFARAFGRVDASNKMDKGKMDALGREWYSYMGTVKFESENTMKQIRELFREKLKQSRVRQAAAAGQGQIDPRTGRPMQQGGMGPGGFPPPGGAGGFPPQGGRLP